MERQPLVQERSRRRTITLISTRDPARAISRAIVMAAQGESADYPWPGASPSDTAPVFVYGSLKRGERNHHWIAAGTYRGEALLPGARLYDLGPFPMAVASDDPADTIAGELYAVTPAMLAALDRFEGVPRLYERQSWRLVDGSQAWVYVGRQRQVRHGARITSGIWQGRRQPAG
jgi:gamma-glutamylcyclotransferase (GGCT)/AIG2-like uncharacterized protein YtfP